MNDSILDRAIAYAVKAHAGQKRKDDGPYILHPMEDAVIVGTMTNDPEVIAAAVLHDTVEDTETTPNDILELFGMRVFELVMHETEDKRPEIPPEESWRIRKEESLLGLKASDDPAVKMLWLGDKLSNLRGFYRLWLAQGDDVFQNFHNPDPGDHRWYYGEILSAIGELKDYPAYKEFEALFHRLFDRFA